MSLITCAFCKGKGKDPFKLLSEIAACQVCKGTGKVEIEEPIIECAFCDGTGVYPNNARITCTVCNGKGSVTFKGSLKKCPICKSTGKTVDSGLPCIECKGRGVMLINRSLGKV